MQEEIDLVVITEEEEKPAGVSWSVIISFVLHTALIIWFVRSYKPVTPTAPRGPMARYVELIRQNPQEQQFTEAPGRKLEKAPMNAPLSDGNRKASMPDPTGPAPTKRPGDGSGIYTPPLSNPSPRGVQQQQQAQTAQQPSQASASSPATAASAAASALNDSFVYREGSSAAQANAAASGSIDWRSAIKQVKGPIGGGGDGVDLGEAGGGDKGYAEQGPLSFETQWYDWGDYAQSMVSRIRVNWYANMPQLIRTGIQGVATIRFTIHRDGRITDIQVLKSSGHPPYDFAARKALELSSPLNPLPADFPNSYERVTAMFYYNMKIP